MSLVELKDYYVPNYSNSLLSLPLLSYEKNEIYNVTIFFDNNLNKFNFNCTCNEKNLYSKKCIHVNNLISLIITNYQTNNSKVDNDFLDNFNNVNILSDDYSVESESTCSTSSISDLSDNSDDKNIYANNYYYINNIHNESISYNNMKTEMLISIKSFVSSDIYLVSIKYNKNISKFQYSCTCGLKFTNNKRKKFKHISLIICSFF